MAISEPLVNDCAVAYHTLPQMAPRWKADCILISGDVVAQVEGFSAENEDVKYLVEEPTRS